MIQLNDRWRVSETGEGIYLQWVLEKLLGGQWIARSFCQRRDALLTAIREKVTDAHRFYGNGKSMPVEPAVLDRVRNLPARTL